MLELDAQVFNGALGRSERFILHARRTGCYLRTPSRSGIARVRGATRPTIQPTCGVIENNIDEAKAL